MKTAFLPFLLFFFFISFSQPENAEMQTDSLQFQSLFTTKNDSKVACYRIPALITAQNGDLIAAIDERVPDCGDLRTNTNINIVQRRSKDNGKTWTEIETVIDYPEGQSASDPSLILDEISGELFLFFNYMDLINQKDIYYLKVMKSTDDGKSWSEPKDITSQITKPEWHKDFKFITSGRGTQTKSGRLLHTLVNLTKGLYLFGSDDHGKSWFLIDQPIQPADESKILELNNGDWMVNSRVNNAGIRFIHTSSDQGKSWTTIADSTLIDPSCNASFIKYSNQHSAAQENILLFSNLNSDKERENLSIRFSIDQGKNWSEPKTIFSGSSAYSSMTVLQNGDIGIFFEKDDYQDNAFVTIPSTWIETIKESEWSYSFKCGIPLSR